MSNDLSANRRHFEAVRNDEKRRRAFQIQQGRDLALKHKKELASLLATHGQKTYLIQEIESAYRLALGCPECGQTEHHHEGCQSEGDPKFWFGEAERLKKQLSGANLMSLELLLSIFKDGDEHGWDVEFNELWSTHTGAMDMLTTSIQETGIQTPILLGNDGRVWDGHHRLAAAKRLGILAVPVQFAPPTEIEGDKS